MPTWLYHKDVPAGRIFASEEEAQKAVADGWVDAQGKVAEPAKEAAKSEKPAKREQK